MGRFEKKYCLNLFRTIKYNIHSSDEGQQNAYETNTIPVLFIQVLLYPFQSPNPYMRFPETMKNQNLKNGVMTLHSSTACGHTEAALRPSENSADTDLTDGSTYDTGNIRLFYPVTD